MDVDIEEADDLLAVGEVVDEILVRKQIGKYIYYRTRRHGSILVKMGKRISVWIESAAPEVSDGLIFRLLAKRDEEALQETGAVLPRNYFGEVTAEGHVLNGGRSGYTGSRFLSASKDVEGVYTYISRILGTTPNRDDRLVELCETSVIAVVDVALLKRNGIRCMDAAPFMRGIMTHNFARAVKEVLIDGEVPDSCLFGLEFLDLAKLMERR